VTIELASLTMILALWSVGGWLSYRESMRHRPRYQGWYRTPCLDVSNRRGHTVHSPRPLEFCN
jgi:hypothetical protein